MKRTSLLLIASLLLICCKTGKEAAASWENATVTTPCPPKTECRFEAMKDKSLLIKKDDTGHTYYNLQDTPGKTVFTYTHKKITDPKLKDAGYSETIIFEADGTPTNLNYSGEDIQKVKMLFNVQCFCRGKAGIYTVKEGTLAYANKKLHIEIPQLVDGQATRVVDILVR